MRVAGQIDRWIFSRVDVRQVAALRIGLASILLWRLTQHDFIGLATQPDGLYRPLSYMQLFDSMPGPGVVQAALVAAFVAAVAAGLGLWSRVTLPIATCCSLLLFGMTTSMGKVMHNEALLLLCLLPLSLGTTDDAWSVRSWWRHRFARPKSSEETASGWPWRVMILLVCGAYFFCRLAKLTHAGLEWVFSDNMRWILYANSDGRAQPNALALLIADHPWLSRASGFGILMLEIGFPL